MAERLVTRAASSIATTAIVSRSAKEVLPSGSRSATAAPRGPVASAATTTPRPSTKIAKPGWAERSTAAGLSNRCRDAQATSTTAAAPDTQNGSTPACEATTKPTSISASTTSGVRAAVGASRSGGTGRAGPRRSSRKSRRSATYSTASTTADTGAIRAAKPAKVRWRCGRASRLVRLETGSSREAELAIRNEEYADGQGDACTASAAPTTTGISSTTVASRLSTAVTRAASTKTPVIRAAGPPPLRRATTRAPCRNTPARAQISPTTRIDIKNSSTGPRCRTTASASAHVSSPVASVARAATTAIPASTRPEGCRIAVTSSTASAGHRHRLAREVGEGRHGRRLRPGDNGSVSTPSTTKPGRYQRSAAGMVGAMVVLLRGDRGLRRVPGADPGPARGAARVDRLPTVGPTPAVGGTARSCTPTRCPPGWIATRADAGAAGDESWSLTMLTDEDRFVGIHQADAELETLVGVRRRRGRRRGRGGRRRERPGAALAAVHR